MLERAEAAGLLFAWITGDGVYGADRALRRWAERHRRGYVLTVTSAQRLGLRSVCERIEHLPAAAWQRLSAGDGLRDHGSTTGRGWNIAAERQGFAARCWCAARSPGRKT